MARAQQEAKGITPLQQMASSCVGALATSLLMTPLDVVKTRLQAQSQVELPCIEKTTGAALPRGSRQHAHAMVLDTGCPKCSYFVLNNGLMEQAVPLTNQTCVVLARCVFVPLCSRI